MNTEKPGIAKKNNHSSAGRFKMVMRLKNSGLKVQIPVSVKRMSQRIKIAPVNKIAGNKYLRLG
jgi:hypothetical protein